MSAATLVGFMINLIFSVGIIPHYLGRKRIIGYVWSMVACLFLTPLIGLFVTLVSPKIEK